LNPRRESRVYIPIISGVFQLGQTWLEGKNKKEAAKAEAQATVLIKSAESEANWESIMATNSGQSWKDEWLTLLFSVPMILVFFPSMVDGVTAGFQALDSMPTWYQYTLSVIVAASFGVRSAIGVIKARKNG
jgi:ABC-type sulfate transport system permease subunit|tara:strand:- start:1441 stop:1836 length:396 start_codon:yes stop_codon:yes gene_type:complete